jgi:hypothetical protein
MTEMVVAVYKTAHAAETALADLRVARVPTVRIVSDPVGSAGLVIGCDLPSARGDSVLAVTVDDLHASLVLSILDMQAPVAMAEAPRNAA